MKTLSLLALLLLYINISFAQFNDEFNSTSLNSAWQLYKPELYETPVPEQNGMMSMILADNPCQQGCPWFHEDSAAMIYQMVSGDFDVYTAVYTKKKSNPSEDVSIKFKLAGLIARDPNSSSSNMENYVFNVVGVRGSIPTVELKSTANNLSKPIVPYEDTNGTEMTGTAAELRMVRQGDDFTFYSRPIGSTSWIQRDTFTRTDLPNSLQVGLIAYTFSSYSTPLHANFDYIRFSDNTLSSNDNNAQSQLDAKFDITVHPTPATKTLSISLRNIQESNSATITIFDVLGKKVSKMTKTVGSEHNIEGVNIQNLKSGSYFIEIKINQTKVYKQFLKQ